MNFLGNYNSNKLFVNRICLQKIGLTILKGGYFSKDHLALVPEMSYHTIDLNSFGGSGSLLKREYTNKFNDHVRE